MTSFESSGNEFSAGIASYASEKGKMYSVYSLDLSNVGTNFICEGVKLPDVINCKKVVVIEFFQFRLMKIF